MIRSDVDVAAADNALRVMHRFAQRLRKARGGAQMRYNPFGLIKRRRLEVFEVDVTTVPSPLPATTADGPSTSNGINAHTTKLLYERNEYTHAASGVRVVLQQRCEAAAPVASDIRAAAADSVDNTGAFHWAAEDILAHLLLRDVAAPTVASGRSLTAAPRRYLELGAGVGLAGFMLVAALTHSRGEKGADAPTAERGSQKMAFPNPAPVAVVLSDGNRAVVDALRANAPLALDCDESFAAGVAPTLHLPWQHHATLLSDVDLAAFDAIIGADCLFFEDFHSALAGLVLRYLALRRRSPRPLPSDAQSLEPSSSAAVVENAATAPLEASDPAIGVVEVGRLSTVTFVAPSRGGSLERFLVRLRQAASAHAMQVAISVTDRYDPAVYAVHQRELADAATSGYEVDRHFPLLVTIW